MVKYLQAECYKLTHRRTYLFGFFAFILGGITAFMLLCKYNAGDGASMNFFLVNLPSLLSIGLYLSLIISDMVFSDQYKFNTLKNEVSFGLPRLRIYLGKLIATAMIAVVFCLIIVLFYAGVAALLFPIEEGLPEVVEYVGKFMLLSLPLWLGGLGFNYMLLFVMKGSTAATVVYMLAMALTGTVVDMLELIQPKLWDVMEAVRDCLLTTPFDRMLVTSEAIGHAWLVGMGWLVIATGIGAIVFRKREIN